MLYSLHIFIFWNYDGMSIYCKFVYLLLVVYYQNCICPIELSIYSLWNKTFAGFKLFELILLLHSANWNIYLHLDWESLFDQRPWSSWQNAGTDKCM